ncbi:MAG: SpoIIE family protein phosphatase, partial [Ignavibacterium sp.]
SYVTYGLLFLSALYGVRKFEMNRKKGKEEKRILQLENKRKTEELNQARKLQLSMLPKDIPSLSNLDIAVYMKTATEVGGDYYDFHKSDDNTITAVIGDATGHGLNAGMLVSVTKGLFKNLAKQTFVNNIFSQFNESIHSLNIQPMYMSLHLLQIKGNQMQVIGAGMPPMLYYQSSTGSVVEIESSGPPLGGFRNFKYEKCDYKLMPGDVLVVMTDGFAERRNNAKEILSGIKHQTSDQIIEQFVEANDNWGEGNPQDDDITFVVIKVK